MQSQASIKSSESIIELEHAIGYSGKIPRSVYLHPNGKDFVYISGACIVITDLGNPHKQDFLREHDDQITCLAISHDGNLIASGQRGDNSDVIIWSFQFMKPQFKLSEHDFEVAVVQFSHDDRLLFSCGSPADKQIFIWDTNTGYIVASCVLKPERIICQRWGGFSKDIKGRDTSKYQFVTAGNKQLVLWRVDAQSGQLENQAINTGSLIRQYMCVEFSKNREDYLFAGTTSGDFCVFQMKTKVLACVVTVGAQGVQSLCAINPDVISAGSGQGDIVIYKTDGPKFTQMSKNTLTGAVNSVSTSPDLQELMCATDKGFVFRVRTNDGAKALQCENHVDSVLFLTYPDGLSDRFASTSEDGTIRLWEITSDYVVNCRCMAAGAGSPLCLTYNDQIVLSGWEDGKIRMFAADSGKLIWQIDNAHKGGVFGIALSRTMKFFVTGGNEGEVRVWEMRSREMVSHLQEHTHRVTGVKLIQNETKVLSGSKDRALLEWDLKSEKRISAHIQRMGGINSFDCNAKGLIVSTGQERQITWWDITHPNPLKSIDTNNNPKQADQCSSIALSHNGKWIATAGSQMVVKIWDINSGDILGEGKGHSGLINAVAFSWDDKQVISGGKDGNIFVWNVFP